MAAEALDIVGYAVLNAAGTSTTTTATNGDPVQSYIPLMRGSQLIDDPGLSREFMALGAPDAITWTQGISRPVLLARAPLYKRTAGLDWVNASRLSQVLVPSTSTGLIAGCSTTTSAFEGFGSVYYQFADEGLSSAVQYSKSKLSRFSISWGGDQPVVATLALVLFGGKYTSLSTPPATVPGTATTMGLAPTGPYFMSQGVTYNSTLADVISGTLTIDMQLQPDITTPITTGGSIDSTTGATFPKDYWNSTPPLVTLDVVQKKGSVVVQTVPDQSLVGPITIKFTDITGAAGNTITFSILGSLRPVTEKTVNVGLAAIRRTYVGMPGTGPSTNSASFSIT